MQDSNEVYMYIGGELKEKSLSEFYDLLAELASKEQQKKLKKNFIKILKGDYNIDSDMFSIAPEGTKLWVFVCGVSRIEDIENFCVENELSFVAHSKRYIVGDGDETSDYTRYEWGPEFDYVKSIPTDCYFSETISRDYLNEVFTSARECIDLTKVPTKINSESPLTRGFAERVLAGENILEVLISRIESEFKEEIILPEFKLEDKKK